MKIILSKKQWEQIGKYSGWIISQSVQEPKEYMIENGLLYDENGDEVFSMKELIQFNVPVFKTPSQANEFLIQLESKTKKSFGRVPEKDYLHDLRYKDTNEQRQKAKLEDLNERNIRLKKGIF